MITLAVVCAVVAATIHVGFFILESVAFGREGVWRIFGIRRAADASAQRLVYLNQGFYNLFLAVGAVVGALIYASGGTAVLVVFALAVMAAAAVVLAASAIRLWPAAMVQGVVPLIGLSAVAVA